MKKFIADSSADMQELMNVSFSSVPLVISTEEKSFTDDATLGAEGVHDMLDYLASYKGRSFTSSPSVDSWLKAFGDADCIYGATITSGLSGTYNSALVAQKMYLEEHPDAKIRIFDSLSTGPELRLIMEKLAELDAAGLPFDQVCAAVEEYQKHTRLFFALKSLHNFSQNGRVSKAVAVSIGVLGISLIGTASKEGRLEMVTKARGDNRVISSLLEQMKKADCNGKKIRISHVENPGLAKRLKDAISERYPDADILISASQALCSYYAERGGLLIGFETE